MDQQTLQQHGLSPEEYKKILGILGRTPSLTELGIFSVMWSEHCSYKSSRVHLRTLPTTGPRVVQGPGENAGAVDVGDGLVAVFKIESHNHPSFIEPYQGAATGVGGIIRDIFTMGARPIALLNSLRFGSLNDRRTCALLEGVVAGIGGYGNSIGIPTVGGEIAFEDCYSGNPLVNVFCLGVAEAGSLMLGSAHGAGNAVYYVGAKTGRDGIHGATMASAEFDEHSAEKRPAVQVGDPFMEKLLLEACLEVMKTGALVGIQDMGAAGLTCSTAEMGARGGTGIEIDVSQVPQRETGMTPYEIMLSESQERMLMVVKQGRESEVEQVFDKWDLHAVHIGQVTDDGLLRVKDRETVVAEISNAKLADDAPLYDRLQVEPEYLADVQDLDIDRLGKLPSVSTALRTLLTAPSIASKRWVYRQYDHMVRTNTITPVGMGAGVVRLKGTDRALALSVDGNGRHCYLDPYRGAMLAVAEAARNVSCAGATPVGATNCLNFGNPQDPEIYWQFKEAVTGIGEACRSLNTPVTGGNVSFYNETGESAVYPTPVIGMVGLLENIEQNTSMEFKDAGDFIVTLGALNGNLGGSEFLRTIHDKIQGPIPNLNMELEMGVQELCLEAIKKGIVKSAHDLSDGGLAVNISESLVRSEPGLGVKLDVSRKLRNDELLFGECQSLIVVTLEESSLYELILLSKKLDVHTQTIGRVTDTGRFVINDLIDVPRKKLEDAYFNSLLRIMSK